MSHADDGDALHGLIRIFFLALLVGFIRKVRKKLLQVCLGGNAVDWHDLHHPAVQFTVPDIALRERLDLQRCDQQVTGFHGVAEEVIVVDVVDLETGVFRVIGRSHTGLAFFQFFCCLCIAFCKTCVDNCCNLSQSFRNLLSCSAAVILNFLCHIVRRKETLIICVYS